MKKNIMKKTKELFSEWNKQKQEIELNWKAFKIVKKWEIWISKIWINIWWENSKDDDFTRPILIVSIWLWWDLIWVLPFSWWYNSNFEKYYFELNNHNKYWLKKESRLLLNQFKVISKKRLLYKINNLSTKNKIKPIIWNNVLKIINEKIKMVFSL